jgi:uncharacterized membrane protein
VNPSLWSKFHGATTHFPIALVFVSAFCDAVAFFGRKPAFRRSFRFAGTVTAMLGALGSYAAVVTGLALTRGQMWGRGALLHHHQFVWPFFILMTALAAWRAATRGEPTRPAQAAYFGLAMLAAMLVGGAGYWGGELISKE